ncbi:MAG TPA: type II/IV secretion system protein [Gemmatimonadaceae bacterium]|nr:type II/IV secretion system protein [Gemmatimonadaceae bacterium]
MSDTPALKTLYTAPATWPDRWLAEAAVRRGLRGADVLAQHAQAANAWEALLASGATEPEVLDLACAVSATKRAALGSVGAAEAALLTQELAERFDVVPVRGDNQTLYIATSNPLAPTLERDLAVLARRRIHVLTATPGDISAARRRCYGAARPMRESSSAPELRAPAPRRPSSSIPVVPPRESSDELGSARSAIGELVNEIVADAMRDGASDLHFEPNEDGLLVRFRVDGALFESRRVGAEQSSQLVRRLKVLAGMDIADTLRPQDGRMSVQHEGRNIDLRISTLPLGGLSEKVVMRVLDSRVAARDLDVIGYSPKELAKVKRLLELPEGLILVTGPTGSGKTSTLYAAVRHVHRPDLNIVTVEDPIEYRIDGINQVQVNEKARMTFAASLRSILRQDPDVVLIGEIRDAETASIAVKASMTGHLVLSTLHASDALSTLDRLYGMEIDTGALSGALKGIIGQRLVRTLCNDCAAPATLDELPAQQQSLLSGRKTERLRKPVGCPACRGTGYRGRTLVAEIFLVTPAIQRAISRRADLGELSELARECGAITMWESGLDRVLSGATSLFELLDNVAAPIVDTPETNAQADVDALLAKLLAQPVSHPAPAREQLPDLPDVTDSAYLRSIDAGDGAATLRAPTSRAPRSISRATADAGALRVLVVHEVHADRRRIADALAAEGLAVIEAADGEQALAYARRLRPQVILTEIALPRLDAVGLLQALSAEQLTPRVMIHTRQTDQELHAWLIELGAEEVTMSSEPVKSLAARLRSRVAA